MTGMPSSLFGDIATDVGNWLVSGEDTDKVCQKIGKVGRFLSGFPRKTKDAILNKCEYGLLGINITSSFNDLDFEEGKKEGKIHPRAWQAVTNIEKYKHLDAGKIDDAAKERIKELKQLRKQAKTPATTPATQTQQPPQTQTKAAETPEQAKQRAAQAKQQRDAEEKRRFVALSESAAKDFAAKIPRTNANATGIDKAGETFRKALITILEEASQLGYMTPAYIQQYSKALGENIAHFITWFHDPEVYGYIIQQLNPSKLPAETKDYIKEVFTQAFNTANK